MKLTSFPQLNINLSEMRRVMPTEMYTSFSALIRNLVRTMENLQNVTSQVVNHNADQLDENLSIVRLSNTQVSVRLVGSDNVTRSVTLTLS